VADAADVSVTTLFNYFPSKEALVFDLDEDIEAALVAAVRDRTPGTSIPQSLREHIESRTTSVAAYADIPAFTSMVESTPALRDYARQMWLRHETALARTIATEIGAPEDDVTCAALARFALEAVELAHRKPDPTKAVDAIFTLLEQGWAKVTGG
jgi:AcrR family transcriptional regulator